MTTTEIALLITAIAGGLGGLITALAALLKTRSESALNGHERDELKKRVAELEGQHQKDRVDIERNRTDLIMIGEAWSDTKYDTATMALLINQLFNQYKAATGQAPEVDIEMLRHMRTIGYITGPLGPLDTESVKNYR